jgi:3'-phosphoadenosine 5'-phosphosulfate sulfotransferase (PAPS reductase)/FAD synthetase
VSDSTAILECHRRGADDTPEASLPERDWVPILLTSEPPPAVEVLKARIDGFSSVADLVDGAPGADFDVLAKLLASEVSAGRAVWRHEWSPLRWCVSCDVPLLQERCDRCGSVAGDTIDLKFPCNPRPVLPHDEFMFRAVGLPWPADLSLLLNAYRRPDYAGWELIHHGARIGDIVCPEGNDDLQFVPAEEHREQRVSSERPPVRMADVAAANRTHCEKAEEEAIAFIREWCTKGRRTLAVTAFSGGKDSAVLAHLCHRSGAKMRVFQIDTGIDPPGNYEYSRNWLASFPRLRWMRVENRDMFWRAMERLGPPSTDFQWCRLVLKNTTRYRSRTFRLLKLLGRAAKLVKLRAVFVEGPRRREEEWRINLRRVVPIPSAPIDTVAIRPILDFTDLDVWMYFHRHALPVNPAYTEEKHQRLLCLFCPDQGRHDLALSRQANPHAWARYEAELERWREIFGFPAEWVRENLWTQDVPRSRRMIELGIPARLDLVAQRLNRHVSVGEVAHDDTGGTVAGKIEAPFDPVSLARWLQPFGTVRAGDGRITVAGFSSAASITVASSGEFALSGRDPEALTDVAGLFRDWLVSHLNCIGCGACREYLPRVSLREGSAFMKRGCRESFEAVRQAVLACPVNARGLRESTRLRQDA